MLTVIIPRTDEPKVILMTQENLIKELYPVEGAELLVAGSWWEGLKQVKTPFVSLVEPDCVVSSGYFASNMGLFRKNSYYRRLAMVSSAVGVRNFANRVFNYELYMPEFDLEVDDEKIQVRSWLIRAAREPHSSSVYPAQIGFVPGAIIRTAAVHAAMESIKRPPANLVELSTRLSFFFWKTERRVAVNPHSTYVSSQEYLLDPPSFNPKVPTAAGNLFKQEGI